MSFIKVTEMPSAYRNLEKMSTAALLNNINYEDATVAPAVALLVPIIEKLVNAITLRMQHGGRLFYIGAGTSGRLGVLDASECPPTYGVSDNLVIAIMAGGDAALRYGVEDAEDDPEQGWIDLQQYHPDDKDTVIGIAASGTTPYVIGALKAAQAAGILTACIVCNAGSPLAKHVDFPIEAVVVPEFVTGSTRMKSGTAQKLILNMISTSVMIRLGKIQDNKMVNMQLSNEKLISRGVSMLMEKTGIKNHADAKARLLKYGSVSKAIENWNNL